jgi:two-component system, NarL family, sensor histidine kinase UhpB
MDEIRRLSHSLIPPSLDDHGLIDAVGELVEELNMVGKFQLRLKTDGFTETVLDDNKKLMLYRVVQEGLNNVVKYAAASEVNVSFCNQDGQLKLTIQDNGQGFDPAKKAKGIGLRNIESRVAYYAGSVEIDAAPGKGTTLSVLLPL